MLQLPANRPWCSLPMHNCCKCETLCRSRTRIVIPTLPDHFMPRILVVKDTPSAREDCGYDGPESLAEDHLYPVLGSFGLRYAADYVCTHIVRCRPPDGRKPRFTEISNCFPYLLDLIQQVQPSAVITVGTTATTALTQVDGLMDNITFLSQHGFDPIRARFCTRDTRTIWPVGTLLVPIPAPATWHRRSPDGRTWSEIGMNQIRVMLDFIGHKE